LAVEPDEDTEFDNIVEPSKLVTEPEEAVLAEDGDLGLDIAAEEPLENEENVLLEDVMEPDEAEQLSEALEEAGLADLLEEELESDEVLVPEEAATDIEEDVDDPEGALKEDAVEVILDGLEDLDPAQEDGVGEAGHAEQAFIEEELSLSGDEDDFIIAEDKSAGVKDDSEGFIDLTKELGVEEALGQLVDSWSDSEESSGMVEEFKAGMGEQLSREDVETHFNLGIAYMEMELFGDAVREFKLSAKEAAFEFNSYARLGQCAVVIGKYTDAVGYYIKALAVKGMSDQDRIGAMYELALAYNQAGEQAEALQMMTAVGNLDHDYRETQEKLVEFAIERSYIPRSDNLIEIELM